VMWQVLDQAFWGNTLLQWLTAVSVALVGALLLRVIRGVAARRLGAFARRTDTGWDDTAAEAIKRMGTPFILVAGIFLGALFLDLPGRVHWVIRSAFVLALLIQVGIWLGVITGSALEQYRRRVLSTNPGAATTINAMGFLSRIVIWSVVVLVALDNLGMDVTAIVAGLGIGGIAVALAVQNILGDLFASLSIILDKPFVIGDFLIIDEYLGSVEYVGLKTTRVRSLSGEQLVFSNSDLLNSRIRNYGRMFERRVVFTIGVTYDTPRSKLERIPGMIRQAVEAHENTRFDRCHFASYGDYALLFETVYYVLSADYTMYMDIQQAVNLAIHEAFEREEVEFAYPTQKLFVQRLASQAAAS